MEILVAAASTSILFAAFYRATQLPDYHEKHHVYNDDDGEAVPAEYHEPADRALRIWIAFFALAAFLLSVWNWTTQEHNSGLAITTIAWVCCQSNHLLTCLTWFADDDHLGLLPPRHTITSKTTAIRYRFAYSCFVTRIVTRLGNRHFQEIPESNRTLGPGCPWSLLGLHMLLVTTAT